MSYSLKTSSFCNNNCIYCEQLNKRDIEHKTLSNIEKELKEAKKKNLV